MIDLSKVRIYFSQAGSKCLEGFSPDYSEIHTKIIQKHPQRAHEISSLLQCISLIQRPLRLKTLLALAAPRVNYHSQITQEGWVRDILTSGFIRTQTLTESSDVLVGLVPQSAKSNLVNGSNGGTEADAVEGHMHFVIGEKLISSLEECWVHLGRPQGDTQSNIAIHPDQADLVYYALQYWPYHARHCGVYANEIFNIDRVFFSPDSRARMYWMYMGFGASPPEPVTGLDLSQANFLWDQSRLSAIHVAALIGNIPWLKLLVEHFGIRLDAVDGFGVTPLQYAALGGHADAVQFFMHSANITAQYGRALWFSVIVGSSSVAQVLVSAGVDVNFHHEVNRDLIDLACTGDDECDGDDDMVMEGKPKSLSLLMTAIEGCHADVLKVLLSGNANLRPNGRSALCHAAAFGDEETFKVLVDHGACIDDQDNEGASALCNALIRGDTGILRILVEWRDILQGTILYPTPMSESEVYEALLNDPNIHMKDQHGRTALHSAVFAPSQENVKRLLWLGLDPNARDCDGNTPLHAAMGFCLNDLVPMRCLLWDQALDRRVYEEVSRLALWSGHSTREQKHQEAGRLSSLPGMGGTLDIIRLLVMYGASVEVTNDAGQSPWSVL